MLATELKPGMRVRLKSVRCGRHWFTVTRVTKQGFLVKVEGEWVTGGAHVLRVPLKQRFVGGFVDLQARGLGGRD